MKLFIKILLFVLVSIVTNVNVASVGIPFINIHRVTSSLSFHKEIPETAFKFIENDLADCCQNEQDLGWYATNQHFKDWMAVKIVLSAKLFWFMYRKPLALLTGKTSG